MRKRVSLIPIGIFTLIFFLLNFYVLGGFQVVFPQPVFPIVFWSTIVVVAALMITAIFRLQTKEPDQFFSIATHGFIMIFASELLFAIILFGIDIYRFIYSFLNTGFPPRSLYAVEFAAIIFLALLLAFLYGMIWGKYAYRVVKHTLYFDDLPSAFDGFKLAQISDIHAGSFTNPVEVQKGIDLIKKQKADLFVFTGDLVNNRADEIKPYVGHFSQVKAPFGQFSILGNHDYGDYVRWPNDLAKRENLNHLRQYHQALDYRLLLDENVALEKDGQTIYLLGVENWGLGFGERGDLERALHGTQTDDFKILLSHDPTHWEAQVKTNPSKIHLTLSGHTHGMQFGIEIFGIKWSPVKWRYKHWAGIKKENGRYLNINRGFGFLGFSGRVGIWPEITIIELKKK